MLLALGFVQGRSDVSDRRTTLDRLDAQIAQKQAAASVSAAAAAQAQAHLAAFTAASSGRPPGTPARPARASDAAGRLARHPAADAGCDGRRRHDRERDQRRRDDERPELVGGASAPAATTFTVTGKALSQDTVARVLDRLALIPALSDVSLQSMQRADVAGKKAMQFTIVANVRTAGGNG